MPKLKTMYCEKCGKVTIHNIRHRDEGAERIFSFIITLRFNEMLNDKYITCTNCKLLTIK